MGVLNAKRRDGQCTDIVGEFELGKSNEREKDERLY